MVMCVQTGFVEATVIHALRVRRAERNAVPPNAAAWEVRWRNLSEFRPTICLNLRNILLRLRDQFLIHTTLAERFN